MTDTLGSEMDEVSVAIREVPANDWVTTVYEPEIAANDDLLFKRWGYGPLVPHS